MQQYEECPVCGRNVRSEDITLHHTKPESLGGTLQQTIKMCKTCHRSLHYCIPLEDVELYDTVEKLEDHELFSLYLEWIREKDHPTQYAAKKAARKWLPAAHKGTYKSAC